MKSFSHLLEIPRTRKEIFQNLALACLTFALVGISLWTRNFAKLHFGKFYILEWVALIWLLSVVCYSPMGLFRAAIAHVPLVAFYVWGFLRFFPDYVFSDFQMPVFSESRTLQHAILFAYAFIWGVIGNWLGSQSQKRWTFLFLVFALVTSVPFLSFSNVRNLGSGPIPIIAFFLSMRLCLKKPFRFKGILLTLFFAVISFGPTWAGWISTLQRTSLLNLIAGILFLPFLLNFGEKSWMKKWVLQVCLSLTILFVGCVLSSWLHSSSLVKVENYTAQKVDDSNSSLGSSVKSNFKAAMLHGEDVGEEGGEWKPARFRTNLWNQTIVDWLSSPVVGVGFVPEVPTWINEWKRNFGGFHGPRDSAPIAGPHNSYLAVLARMGVVGLGLLIWIAWELLSKVFDWVRMVRKSPILLVPMMLVTFGALTAAFNLGFESPHNAAVFWLSVGFLSSVRRYFKVEFNLK